MDGIKGYGTLQGINGTISIIHLYSGRLSYCLFCFFVVQCITGRGESIQAVFDDLNCLLIRGPFSERNRDKYIYYCFGRTARGRYLMVVLLDEGRNVALPVTARNMTRAERRRYKEANNNG